MLHLINVKKDVTNASPLPFESGVREGYELDVKSGQILRATGKERETHIDIVEPE